MVFPALQPHCSASELSRQTITAGSASRSRIGSVVRVRHASPLRPQYIDSNGIAWPSAFGIETMPLGSSYITDKTFRAPAAISPRSKPYQCPAIAWHSSVAPLSLTTVSAVGVPRGTGVAANEIVDSSRMQSLFIP